MDGRAAGARHLACGVRRAHGRPVAGGTRADRVPGRQRAAGADQPRAARGSVGQFGDAADGHGGRRRLLPVLPASRTRGAGRRTGPGERAADRRRHLRTFGTGLRDDGAGGDGRDVLVWHAGAGRRVRLRKGTRPSMTLSPSSDISAGSTVTEPTMAMSTTEMVATANPANKGSRFWKVVLDRVLARPGISAALAAGFLLALASPVIGLHTEMLSIPQMLPASTPIVQSYDRIMTAFPGGPAPALVVVKASDIQAPAARQAIAALVGWHSPAIGQPIEVNVYPAANLAQITIPLAGSGTDATSRHALTTLHDTIVPATVGKIPGGEALVGGNLAASIDWNGTLRNHITMVFAFVMGVTFLLMLVAFGSIVIATTTIGLNLLSVGAAYGVLVAVFQHGWGAALLGTTAPGALESWIPLFIFVVLFGLSMDYNVFVVSRIKEGHDHGMATRQAVAHGIRSTAGVVTSAAVIMVAVFAVFGTLTLQQFKQLSVGLAVAVLLDATVVRGVLLPSVMKILGDRNWYRPRWLSRLRPPSPPEPGGTPGPGDRPATPLPTPAGHA